MTTKHACSSSLNVWLLSGLLTLVSAFALSVVTPATVEAQATEIITACHIPGTGTLYRIGEPGLPPDCVTSLHIRFEWNEAGVNCWDTDGDGFPDVPWNGLLPGSWRKNESCLALPTNSIC